MKNIIGVLSGEDGAPLPIVPENESNLNSLLRRHMFSDGAKPAADRIIEEGSKVETTSGPLMFRPMFVKAVRGRQIQKAMCLLIGSNAVVTVPVDELELIG